MQEICRPFFSNHGRDDPLGREGLLNLRSTNYFISQTLNTCAATAKNHLLQHKSQHPNPINSKNPTNPNSDKFLPAIAPASVIFAAALMQKRLILSGLKLSITLQRLCHQLIESHQDFQDSVLIGLQPRGTFLAERMALELEAILKKQIQVGYLDITFYRDDFRRHSAPLAANATRVPFLVEGKKVILIDDVLYTGRSVRAALDAMTAFGRPAKVELLTLIDRKYTRELPIEATYTGLQVNTIETEKVLVDWQSQGAGQDAVWLLDKTDKN